MPMMIAPNGKSRKDTQKKTRLLLPLRPAACPMALATRKAIARATSHASTTREITTHRTTAHLQTLIRKTSSKIIRPAGQWPWGRSWVLAEDYSAKSAPKFFETKILEPERFVEALGGISLFSLYRWAIGLLGKRKRSTCQSLPANSSRQTLRMAQTRLDSNLHRPRATTISRRRGGSRQCPRTKPRQHSGEHLGLMDSALVR